MLTLREKAKITFIHHALWSLARCIQDEKVKEILLKQYSELTKFAEPNQERYCRLVTQGSIALLHDTEQLNYMT